MTDYATPPTFDISSAETILEPQETGEGNWVGAPCVHRHDETTYLAVRLRDPKRRGYAVRIYERPTPGTLNQRHELTADDLGVVSVERPALTTNPRTGQLQLYLPVDRGSNDWVIRKFADTDHPEEFDPATAHDVLRPRPGESDAATVKDPYVLTVGGRYYMYYAGNDGQSEQAHLATSVDGETWERVKRGPVLSRAYWHDYHTRISCAVPAPDAPVWLVFYEGSGMVDANRTWNIRTGIAVSPDLKRVTDTSPDGPRYAAPTADADTGLGTFGTFRYVDVLRKGSEWEVFAEVAREDGSFDLRRMTVQFD
ncbi:glycoside hydrolase family protein [Halorussus halophilus]|uniref:hypothetical protein n=1 Tax=Halorussus halophilus TaxID=2650975 RepID=UPI0013014FA5|nr:hypothetical protein [Halorussus halophilus]